MYSCVFKKGFDPEFEIIPKEDLANAPILLHPASIKRFPGPGTPLQGNEMKKFVEAMTLEIAEILGLQKKEKREIPEGVE